MNNKQLTDTDIYTMLAEKRRILGDIEYIGYIAHKLVDTGKRLKESMLSFLQVIEKEYECKKEDT